MSRLVLVAFSRGKRLHQRRRRCGNRTRAADEMRRRSHLIGNAQKFGVEENGGTRNVFEGFGAMGRGGVGALGMGLARKRSNLGVGPAAVGRKGVGGGRRRGLWCGLGWIVQRIPGSLSWVPLSPELFGSQSWCDAHVTNFIFRSWSETRRPSRSRDGGQ